MQGLMVFQRFNWDGNPRGLKNVPPKWLQSPFSHFTTEHLMSTPFPCRISNTKVSEHPEEEWQWGKQRVHWARTWNRSVLYLLKIETCARKLRKPIAHTPSFLPLGLMFKSLRSQRSSHAVSVRPQRCVSFPRSSQRLWQPMLGILAAAKGPDLVLVNSILASAKLGGEQSPLL